MPLLSERDLSLVEKLFNVILTLFKYDRVYSRDGRSAVAMGADSSDSAFVAMMTPSSILREYQNQKGIRDAVTPMPATSAVSAHTDSSERRTWTELAFLIHRVVMAQKLSLMSYVTHDPGLMVTYLARMLLAFLQESCAAVAQSEKEVRMGHVALLAQDRLVYLLRVFCSLKNCSVMLSDTGGGENAGVALKAYNAICNSVVSGNHLAWMSQIYVWFCDEASRVAGSGGSIPSAYVYVTHDALRCIFGCCTHHEECSKAFLYSEPVAYVEYMFYGLKLRISQGDPLRPYEHAHPTVENVEGTADDTSTAQHRELFASSNDNSGYTSLGVTTCDEPERTVMSVGSVPQRPPGAGYLTTRYFTALIPSFTQKQQQMPEVSTSHPANSCAVASLVCPTNGSTTGCSGRTSWAFDLPELSRTQLKTLLLEGRGNAFDLLLFAALDIVIEVLRVTRDYGHWMVLSTVANLLLLSEKSIGAHEATAASSLGQRSASASEVSPPLSKVVAMHENIIVLFQLLFSVMGGIGFETRARSKLSPSLPPTTTARVWTHKEGRKGNGKGTRSPPELALLSGRLSPSIQPRETGTSTIGMCEVDQLPGIATVKGRGKAVSVDIAQVREYIAQQIVHMVLQTDLHAVFEAMTRVLECDRTLFRVLHSFCLLDTRSAEQAMYGKRFEDQSFGAVTSAAHRRRDRNSLKTVGAASHKPTVSLTGGARGGGCTTENGGECEPTFDAGQRFLFTSNFGDLRNIAMDVGCAKTVEVSFADNAGSLSSSRHGGGAVSVHRSWMEESGTTARLCTAPLQASSFSTQQRFSEQLWSPQHQQYNWPSEDKGGGKKKAVINTCGGGGGSFAKSFFKSCFGNQNAGSGAVTVKRVVSNEESDDTADQLSWSGSSGSLSCSSCCESKAVDSSSSSNGAVNDKSNRLSSERGLLRGSFAGLRHLTRSFGTRGVHSPVQQGCNDSRRIIKGGIHHRYRRRRFRKSGAYSAWRDVPSYMALSRELVRIFNLVLADSEMSVDIRLGAGLLLQSIVLRDIHVFRFYEGRVLIRSYLNLLLRGLRYNIKRPGMSTRTPIHRADVSPAYSDEVQEQQQSMSDIHQVTACSRQGCEQIGSSRSSCSSSMVSGRLHLTERELIAFVPKVMETLEQTFKVLGVVALKSDVESLTELPLFFCRADDGSPLTVDLERSFTRVVVLWLIGLVGAQCDEDIDRRAMEVLMHLMSRAVARGSLPKDSSTTLMVTPFGPATIAQGSNSAGVAVLGCPTMWEASFSANWAHARRTAPLAAVESATGVLSSSRMMASSTSASRLAPAPAELRAPTAAGMSMLRSGSQLQNSSIGVVATEHNAETDPYHRHFNKSLCTTEFAGPTTSIGTEAGLAECDSTVEALSLVFRVLLGRSQDLLSPAGLCTLLSLFTSHDGNLSRLGRECMIRSLDIPSVYPLYADVILDSDTFLLTQTLSMLSTYLTSLALTPASRRERRLWMQRYGCVDAAIRVLVRVLDAPQSTSNFMKVISHLFQFLSAFESRDCKPACLSATNFVASVTERLETWEGVEYFFTVTQAVLDASMGAYDRVYDRYTSAEGPGVDSTTTQAIGSFRVALHNCAAEKPIFLDLLPSLLNFAKSLSEQLFTDLVEVLLRILECTSMVRSDRLTSFVLDHGLSRLLPYVELSKLHLEERLPYTGTAADLHKFWKPLLLHAPRRSRLRFTSHGGVQVSVGLWPDTGFTISAWFKFDRLYLTTPLFEFHGVLQDGSATTLPLRCSSMTASLFVFGGDSMQLTTNDGQRVTINENQALPNFCPQKWMHVCAVLHTTHTLDVYVSGFKAGTTVFPYFAAGAEVRVNVGCTDDVPYHATSLSTDSRPLFSMGNIVLWARSLSQLQVKAELASGHGARGGTVTERFSRTFPAKILKEGVAHEMTFFGHMGIGGGLGTPMSSKPQSKCPSGVAGLSLGTTNLITAGVLKDSKDDNVPDSNDACSLSAARIACFVPFENDDDMLLNVLAHPTGLPVISKLVGCYATPPKTWVDYPLLWASRGGIVRMLDWMHLVTSSAELEDLLQVTLECMQRTTLAVTLDPRTYVLFAYMLTNEVACYMTKTACDHLFEFASSYVNILDEQHRVVINRLIFEHVLGDVRFYAALQLETALYLLERVSCLFQTSQCLYAKHNARVVSPYRFTDRLLHSLIGVAARTPLLLCRAVVKVAQQLLVACDMEDGLVQIFISLIALLTPEEMTVNCRCTINIKVELPAMESLTPGTEIPLRTANHLTTLLLLSLVDCSSQSLCISALSRTVDLPWYAVCTSRFADPIAVVYATRIFFEAVAHNPVLQEEVAQHQSTVVEILTEHAVHEDLILLLLAFTVGAARRINVLSSKHSLRQQLDSFLNTFSPEPDAVVAPIFVQLLIIHLHRVVQPPWRRLKEQAVLQDGQQLSYRVRRYFSLARVCSRLMILIRAHRYRTLLTCTRSPEAGASSVEKNAFSGAHHPGWRSTVAVNSSSSSQNVRFVRSSGAMVTAGAPAANVRLANAPAVSSTHSRAPLDPLSHSSLTVGATIDVWSGDDDNVVTNVALPPPQSLSHYAEYQLGCSNVDGCGVGVCGDKSALPLDSSRFHCVADLPPPVMLPAHVPNIGGDDHSSSSASGSGSASQWKPPVLLPEMCSSPAPSPPAATAGISVPSTTTVPATAAEHELTAAPVSRTDTVARQAADNAPKKTCQVTAAQITSSESLCPMQEHLHVVAPGYENAANDDAAAGCVNMGNIHLKGTPGLRVCSCKHRRAFSVLRVCVLLWLSLQLRRCRGVSTPLVQPYEEDSGHRHAGTQFCIRVLHRFASMPNYFYLLVSSPMQTAALSSLAAYISGSMLLDQLDMWEQMVSSMLAAPAREPAVVSEAAAARMQTTADEPQSHRTQEEETPVSPTSNEPADEGMKSAEDTSRGSDGLEHLAVGYQDPALQASLRHMPSSHPVIVASANSTRPHHSPGSRSCSSSAATSNVGVDNTQKGDDAFTAVASTFLGMPETVLPCATRPSCVEFPNAGASSVQLDNMTVLESPHPILALCSEELGKAVAQKAEAPPQRAVPVEDRGVSTVTNESFGIEGLPLVTSASEQLKCHSVLKRSPHSLERSSIASPHHTHTDHHSKKKRSSATTGALTTATAVTMGPGDLFMTPFMKLDEGDNVGDHDDTPSVSSSAVSLSTHSSSVSSSSIPVAASSARLITAADAKMAVSHPVVSVPTLPGVAAPPCSHGLSDVYTMSVASTTEPVGEVLCRDAGRILGALIRSSLDTLPMPNWIGGSTYGSCGGLLFQLLFIVSAKTTAGDSTTTLVRYFLLCVGNAVKEQRDRDIVHAPNHNQATSSLEGALFPKAPITGLGGEPLDVRTAARYAPSSNVSPRVLGREALALPESPGSVTTGAAGASRCVSGGGLSRSVRFASDALHTTGVPSSTVPCTAGCTLPIDPVGTQGSDGEGGCSSKYGGASLSPTEPVQVHCSTRSDASLAQYNDPRPQSLRGPVNAWPGNELHHGKSSSASAATGVYSDVFLFNVSHFTDLIVDMIAINVLDLPMTTHFFLTLLVLCQGWPHRYVEQLSWKVMRACISVLNRPSTQDASVSLIENVYTLSTLVLRRGWKHKGVLESLVRVLYRVFVSLPPAWMPEADVRHRKRLITLIFRHIVQTYAGTKELEKALTVRTLTQRLSLYEDFCMIFSLNEDNDCCETFEQYCVEQFSSIDTLMSNSLKAKADLAFKANIKTRSEYIKRIKIFKSQYRQVMELPECYRRAALRRTYTSRFSSYVATTPHVDSSQLHWLLSSTCALPEHRFASCSMPWHKVGSTSETAASPTKTSEGEAPMQYHFMDPQMNYGVLKSMRWGEKTASQSSTAKGPEKIMTASGAHGDGSGADVMTITIGKGSAGTPKSARSASTRTKMVDEVTTEEATTATKEYLPKNDLIHAAQCEELPQHIALLVPPLRTHFRPYIGDDSFRTTLKDLSIMLTPSAVTLLHYLVSPHETVRFLSNGFRINGMHATPCLILLTNVTLKVIGFSRVTEAGDIILCEHEVDDDDAHCRRVASEPSTCINNNVRYQKDAGGFSGNRKLSLSKPTRRNPFSVASMTKQLQKLFSDNSTKRRQQQDGTRVAQAVRQVIGCNYQNIYWTYLVSSICAVRSLHYLHLDTAVQLQLYYDNGPMLSVVDAKQSMNPSARKEFIRVLKDVVGTQQCAFMDESQRAANVRGHLVRWATGSVSNYEYLRFLNEVAGRTNRDLNQYPVFPWVLADYTSATLDLEAASTFRDFAYPMGAQTDTRRAAVARLFESTRELCDAETGKSYPFHHGTHYSTAGGVLYFLIRAQPFTTYARLLQGGDFDLAMRLFDSVTASFMSCVTGPADCKELIPEFYVNSGFLTNADHLSLGTKSDGQTVDDVILPPWAKNSPQVFTAVMRYALECPYVVAHLHQWIDLVFGVRRRGPLALERYNVFQRMTYGEEVLQALKNAETPHDCDVIVAEVDNFGQAPLQLFQERHPSHHELALVVKASPEDGSVTGVGSGVVACSDISRRGRDVPTATWSAVNNICAVTLGGLYTPATVSVAGTAATVGAGTHIGGISSNLLSPGVFASGKTYTQTFCREAPKVVWMLIHAMDETQTWFVLREPPSSVLQHPPLPALTDIFCFSSQPVLDFSMLRTFKKLVCTYAQLVPVRDTYHYLCWHQHEAQLMRYTAGQATFHSTISFDARCENGSHISAVAVGPRESVLLVALSSGTVYCFFPDDAGDGALYVQGTLCYHRSPVTKIVLESGRHRAVTITNSPGDDEPILWRVQRSGCSFVCRLQVQQLLQTQAHAFVTSTEETSANTSGASTVADVAIDTVSGNVALVTARSLLLFDNNGEPFGVGTLPSPTSLRPVGTVTLEDDNGDVGVVVHRPVLYMANMTAVAFYQTSEWASGMGVLLTGHEDGSLSAWRTTRLPPHAVAPGSIAMVEFHARLFSGTVAPKASATVSVMGGLQDAVVAPLAACAGSRGVTSDASPSASAVFTGSGPTNCPVTALHQENVDVPSFMVGYANGSVRQLVFEDPALAYVTGSVGGAAGVGNRVGGDCSNQRR